MFRFLMGAVLVFGMLVSPATAIAQAPGTSTITFAGQPLSGNQDEMAEFLLGTLRPAVASVDPNLLSASPELKPLVPTAGCFGVTELKSNGWRLLRETRFKTDLSNGRYEAVVPGIDEHGDWPPHGILFKMQSSGPVGCQELIADISYRMLYMPDSNSTLAYTFKLNPDEPDAYSALASQGDLGLFVASETPIEVNLELLAGRACHDCMAHTRATTTTIGSGVYTPDTVEWFGELTEGDDVAFDEMYVLPVPEDYSKQWSVVINAPANSVVWIWFGRFDVPTPK